MVSGITKHFTKWVEAIPLKKATGVAISNFICKHIITWFGVPTNLISDNGTPFVNKDVRSLLKSIALSIGDLLHIALKGTARLRQC